MHYVHITHSVSLELVYYNSNDTYVVIAKAFAPHKVC